MISNKKPTISNEIYMDLIKRQRKCCKDSKKLNMSELKRISKNLNVPIFDTEECSIWTGYITNNESLTKPSYINFYYRTKKIALHRLLYENFFDSLEDNQYIKFTCKNKGKCCNIKHFIVVNSDKTPISTPTSTPTISPSPSMIVSFD